MTIKRYVGIDPSSKTGLYIQDVNGKLIYENDLIYSTNKDPDRMISITDAILEQLNLETDVICIESFSFNSKGRGIDFQFGIGWIIRENLHRNGFKYYDVTPNALKKFATGNGTMKKEAMVEPIERRWNFYHPSDNITDAFVLSEIAKAIDLGKDYKDLKEHEKVVVRTVLNGNLNNGKWKEVKPPSWMNPKSKYYFVRDKQD